LAADSLEEDLRRTDPDRWLSSRFVTDAAARADVVALYAYDHELNRAGLVASNSLIGEIRLTWWREVLDQIHGGLSVRHHPVAQALAGAVRRHDLPRPLLEAMIDARIEVLDQAMLDQEAAVLWADAVGGGAAVLAVRILDAKAAPEAVRPAGRVWGLSQLKRAGRADAREIDRLLKPALKEARRAASFLSAAAFPAVAHATLARARTPAPLAARVRLVAAVAVGRI
jgi:phytoene synthase